MSHAGPFFLPIVRRDSAAERLEEPTARRARRDGRALLYGLRNATVALWPPKPKVLLKATLTFRSLGSFGT